MISFKRYLEPTVENLETLLKVLQMLLQGIATHVVDQEGDRYVRFRRGIQTISESFHHSLPKSEFFALAEAAVQSLDEYNQQAGVQSSQRKIELETMIQMLTEAVGSISSAGGENIARLQEIEQLVRSAKEVSDINVVKAHLGDCLEGIRSEAIRQRTETEKTTRALIQEIEKSRRRVDASEHPNQDSVTGLPSREAAESALAVRCACDTPAYVAVIMADRLHFYNARFGRVVGDDILRHFADYIRKSLPAQDELFRWTGPTLVAVLDRYCELEEARLELKQILDRIPDRDVETKTRSALLSMSSRWAVFPVTPALQLVIRKIDMFANVQRTDATRPGSLFPHRADAE